LGANTSQGVCTAANGSLICALGTLANGASAAATVQLAFALPGTVTLHFGHAASASIRMRKTIKCRFQSQCSWTRIQVRLDRARLCSP